MKKEKTRLANLASKMRISGNRSSEILKSEIGKEGGEVFVEANPPHGERGDFRKITVTLPPEVYVKLVHESSRRKIAGEKDHLLSAIVREAVVRHLEVR